MDPFCADFGHSSWPAQFKLSLLAGLGPLATGCPPLMPRILRYTHLANWHVDSKTEKNDRAPARIRLGKLFRCSENFIICTGVENFAFVATPKQNMQQDIGQLCSDLVSLSFNTRLLSDIVANIMLYQTFVSPRNDPKALRITTSFDQHLNDDQTRKFYLIET